MIAVLKDKYTGKEISFLYFGIAVNRRVIMLLIPVDKSNIVSNVTYLSSGMILSLIYEWCLTGYVFRTGS